MNFFGRQPPPQPKSVVELLMTGSKPSIVTSARRPKPDATLGRYLDAQRARERQAALANRLAGESPRAPEGANRQQRHAAAVIVAEAYDEARSLTEIELDLMVAAKVIRISDCTECEMDIHDSDEGLCSSCCALARCRREVPDPGPQLLPAGPTHDPGTPERHNNDYVRPGTTSLFADLDRASGKVIGFLRQRHWAEEFQEFLAEIDTEVPADLDVHLILDKYATQRTPRSAAGFCFTRAFTHTSCRHRTRGSTWWSGGSLTSPPRRSSAEPIRASRHSRRTSVIGSRPGTTILIPTSGSRPPTGSSLHSPGTEEIRPS